MAEKNAQPVKIISDKHNRYATIIRAMITAANACKHLEKEDPKAGRNLRAILALKDWADENYKKAII